MSQPQETAGPKFPASVPPHLLKEEKPGRPIFPAVLALILALVLVGAWIAQGGGAAPAAAAPAAAPAATPDPAPSGDLQALRAQLDDLAKQTGDLRARLDAMPEPPPAPDLGPIRAQLDDLAKVPEIVGPLPRRLEDLGGRVDAMDQAIASLRSELASVPDRPRTRPEPAPSGAGPGPNLGQAADLFKQGKYAEARDAFLKLTASGPDDARAWYYAALAHGLATRKWDGETERLVKSGVEREKAGTTERSAIDAAFAGLTRATGKDWLDYHRKRAQ